MAKKPRQPLFSVDDALNLSRREIIELHQSYLNTTLVSMFKLLDFDKKFVKAEGVFLWDEDGKRYIDFLAGYGSLNVGHNNPEILAAVDKVNSRPNILQASLGAMPAALAHNLAVISPAGLKHSFFCNSGTEAVEGGLKLARLVTGRHKVVSAVGAFHGKTLGSLSVSGREKYKKLFRPLLEGCYVVKFGDEAALDRALDNRDVAAFIVEPIQGEAGVIPPPPGYLKKAAEICKKYGTLFIVDEIQTGLGRTGDMFACDHEHVKPDIMLLSKSLGGGVVPIGAILTTAAHWKAAYGTFDKALLHTSTFGGNARACAAGIAAVNYIIDNGLTEQAKQKGAYLLKKLQALQADHPMIKEVRGRGLLIGLEFKEPFKGYVDKFTGGALNKLYHEYFASLVASQLVQKYGIVTAFTLNNPNVLRFEPPLTIEYEQLDILVTALDDICGRNKTPGRMLVRAGQTYARRAASRPKKTIKSAK
ncbi:MAG: aspartate aminotransferase family protein [Actinomycetota bacterium]